LTDIEIEKHENDNEDGELFSEYTLKPGKY
jgi:hypothetical protein